MQDIKKLFKNDLIPSEAVLIYYYYLNGEISYSKEMPLSRATYFRALKSLRAKGIIANNKMNLINTEPKLSIPKRLFTMAREGQINLDQFLCLSCYSMTGKWSLGDENTISICQEIEADIK